MLSVLSVFERCHLAFLPMICERISGVASPGFFPSNAPFWFFPAALLFTVVCGLLFVRERGKRTAQLVRLERERLDGRS